MAKGLIFGPSPGDEGHPALRKAVAWGYRAKLDLTPDLTKEAIS